MNTSRTYCLAKNYDKNLSSKNEFALITILKLELNIVSARYSFIRLTHWPIIFSAIKCGIIDKTSPHQ